MNKITFIKKEENMIKEYEISYEFEQLFKMRNIIKEKNISVSDELFNSINYESKLIDLIDKLIFESDGEIIDYLNGNKSLTNLTNLNIALENRHDDLRYYIEKRDYKQAKKIIDNIIFWESRRELFMQENEYLSIIRGLINIKEIAKIDYNNFIYKLKK